MDFQERLGLVKAHSQNFANLSLGEFACTIALKGQCFQEAPRASRPVEVHLLR